MVENLVLKNSNNFFGPCPHSTLGQGELASPPLAPLSIGKGGTGPIPLSPFPVGAGGMTNHRVNSIRLY